MSFDISVYKDVVSWPLQYVPGFSMASKLYRSPSLTDAHFVLEAVLKQDGNFFVPKRETSANPSSCPLGKELNSEPLFYAPVSATTWLDCIISSSAVDWHFGSTDRTTAIQFPRRCLLIFGVSSPKVSVEAPIKFLALVEDCTLLVSTCHILFSLWTVLIKTLQLCTWIFVQSQVRLDCGSKKHVFMNKF